MFRGKRLSARSPQSERARRNERIAFRYIGALERGDFETIGAALDEAAHDADLARMLREIDAAYLAELDSIPNTKENQSMVQSTIATRLATQDRREIRSIGMMRLSPILMSAAVLVLTLSVVFIMQGARFNGNLPDGSGGNGAPMGVSAQEQTATPFPSFVPTSTPLPATMDAPMIMATATPVPYVPGVAPSGVFIPPMSDGWVNMGGLCLISSSSMNVYSRPSADAAILTQMMGDTGFRIQTYAFDDDGALWLNIYVGVETASFQGWIATDGVFRVTLCPGVAEARAIELTALAVMPENNLIAPTVVPPDQIVLTATALFAEAASTRPDSIEAQATALILEATARAAESLITSTATPIGG